MAKNNKPTYVNNTGQDIRFLQPHFKVFHETGVIHEDIADLFALKTIFVDGQKRTIINMKEDD